MDYILTIVYANGEATKIPCHTEPDVANWIITSMRSEFDPNDLNRKIVNYQVVRNY